MTCQHEKDSSDFFKWACVKYPSVSVFHTVDIRHAPSLERQAGV